ncbi:hypothetical protein DFQ30_001654 [Apophysomyces sp. BC1015]|nr:hypothetical protein DFQ30_001654 [Apophysomyces sp. BC1015]
MDRLGRQLLAGAGLAEDQHRRVRVRHLANHAKQLLHRFAVPNHLALGVTRVVPRIEFGHLMRAPEHIHHQLRRSRHRDEIEAMTPHASAHVRAAQLRDGGCRHPHHVRVKQHWFKLRNRIIEATADIEDPDARAGGVQQALGLPCRVARRDAPSMPGQQSL